MTPQEFIQELDARVANYDLLCHPFYQAWNDGQLSHDDLREYAQHYYHHVKAFPTYLAELGIRLDEGELRRAILANLMDEVGKDAELEQKSAPHSELWLDFAEGMGARRDLLGHRPAPEIMELTKLFHSLASEGTPAEALAAFYAYESQVPRLSKVKASGLRERYGATQNTCAYFTLHETADVHHANVWRRQLEKLIERNPEAAGKALAAAEKAAQALWRALDGIEARRMAMAA
ncbi:MAG TPA: iron-containing redox enzyme family protein [Terriglobales bacterium]|nr:iron-containing redox enzyme family protein [Terriglobales bacterium]